MVILKGNKITVDQSSFRIPNEVKDEFNSYIEKNEFVKRFIKIRDGEICNLTEKRSATHFQYRCNKSSLHHDNLDVMDSIVKKINDSYERVVFFGIGGSFLGPMLLNDAFGNNGKQIVFVTGSDPDEYMHLKDSNLSKTAFVFGL